jgi:hypothetical protein
MGGAIPPHPNTPLWRGAWLKNHRDNFTFTFTMLSIGVYHQWTPQQTADEHQCFEQDSERPPKSMSLKLTSQSRDLRFTLKMGAARSSETMVNYITTWRHNLEDREFSKSSEFTKLVVGNRWHADQAAILPNRNTVETEAQNILRH